MENDMKMIKFGVAALLMSVPLSVTAYASDVEGVCLSKMAEETDLPPEVTQDHINSFCSCLSDAVNADDSLLTEFTEKVNSDVEEEMGDGFREVQNSCKEQAMAG
jgi:hypothetical protein